MLLLFFRKNKDEIAEQLAHIKIKNLTVVFNNLLSVVINGVKTTASKNISDNIFYYFKLIA